MSKINFHPHNFLSIFDKNNGKEKSSYTHAVRNMRN